MCTGSQGEPLSALARMANGDHKTVQVERGDTVDHLGDAGSRQREGRQPRHQPARQGRRDRHAQGQR